MTVVWLKKKHQRMQIKNESGKYGLRKVSFTWVKLLMMGILWRFRLCTVHLIYPLLMVGGASRQKAGEMNLSCHTLADRSVYFFFE